MSQSPNTPSPKPEPVNVAQKFSTFNEHWSPKIVGELNGQYVKIARLKGEFVMHQHEEEDEMFLVLEGILKMQLEDRLLTIETGEFVIIPRKTMHQPIADEEVKIMLFEPQSTLNTGNTENEFTQRDLDKI
ncbi:MAG: cupin domain-containing protein [Bacteroidota bacterium]